MELPPPHLDFCVKGKCAMSRVSLWVCSITKEHQRVWLMQLPCSLVSYVPCSSWSHPKRVSNQEYPKVHTWQHVLAFIKKKSFLFYNNPGHLPVVLNLWSLSLTTETSSCSYQWWYRSQLYHQTFSINVQAARLVPWCYYEICSIYDKQRHLQPYF
jgi:hypothetical protein